MINMIKKITIIFSIILLFGFVFAEDSDDYLTIKSQEYEIGINSPVTMKLNPDFKINPESIQIRDKSNLEIVSGQSFIYRYDFENKLDYSVVGRYELSLGIEDLTQMKNLGIYISEGLTDIDCVKENGELLKYNNNRIEIIDSEKTLNLCSGTKTMDYYIDKDKLVLDMVLVPGTNTKYFLFVTTPTFSLVDSTFSFKDSIKLKNSTDTEFFNNENTEQSKTFGPISTSNTENSEELKELEAYNNQEEYVKVNPNFNTSIPKTKEVIGTPEQESRDSNLTSTQKFKEDAGILKSKATALITMTPTKWGILVFGVLAIVALALFVYSRKDKDLSDVH